MATLWEVLTDWAPPAPSSETELLKQATTVVAIPFGGHLPCQMPGSTNQCLAKLTDDLSKRFSLPVITQWEISEVLSPITKRLLVIGDSDDFHINTREFFEQVAEQVGTEPFVVVSQVAHAKRVHWVCERLNLKPVWPRLGEPVYDRCSTQWWARGPVRWHFWELCSRLLFWWRGWI